MKEILQGILIAWWVLGLYAAKGFWMTTAAIIPLVAWVIGLDYGLTHWSFCK